MAFIDARNLPNGHLIEADLCIVGSGAAGLAIASTFLDRATRVAMLESGGTELETDVQALYRGRIVGQHHAPLDACRLRYLGGTTNHWTAHVRPLDEIDFEERPWVPHSGWPFGPSELAPWYDRARTLLGLPEHPFRLEPRPDAVDPLDAIGLETQVRHIIPERDRRLGTRFAGELGRSTHVDTYLHANVLRLALDEARTRVLEVEIGTLTGLRLRARAKRFVLAAGGIENPRILLLSSIGTHEDVSKQLVGGFFSNHPEGWGGYLQPFSRRLRMNSAKYYSGFSKTSSPLHRLKRELQRERKLLNCWLMLRRGRTAEDLAKRARSELAPPAEPQAEELDGRSIAELAGEPERDPRDGRAPKPIGVRLIAEAAPNPLSRVRLGDERDALGQRKVVLDWRLSPQVSESAERTLQILAENVGSADLGRFRFLFPSGGFESIRTVGSHHHMGTTRMHRDPKRGVVDANCRVHGLSNLFIGGSSVFPTYGTANPTYTILALAYRLADHLQTLEERG